MLENAEQDGYDHIISWMPDGTSFKIHVDGIPNEDEETAIAKVLKIIFPQMRFKSFLRQLQLYGFEQRTCKGLYRGEYKHELFVRGRRDLLDKKHNIRNSNVTSNNSKDNRSPESALQSTMSVEVVSPYFAPPPSLCSTTVSGGCSYSKTSKIPCKLHNLVLTGINSSIDYSDNDSDIDSDSNSDDDDDEYDEVIFENFSSWTETEHKMLRHAI